MEQEQIKLTVCGEHLGTQSHPTAGYKYASTPGRQRPAAPGNIRSLVSVRLLIVGTVNNNMSSQNAELAKVSGRA